MASQSIYKWKIPIVFAGSIFFLYLIGNYTGILQFYKVPSASNEPEIKQYKSVIASILKKPKHNDFIIYFLAESVLPGNGDECFVHRLCGMPNDTILIKEGTLFVNGHNADDKLQLKHHYRVSAVAYAELVNHKNSLFSDADVSIIEDSIDMFLPDHIVAGENHLGRRLIMPVEYVDDRIKQQYNKPWNEDQFGPVIVPPGCYFVMGDNRNASVDSRYIGFIPVKNWRRTVL